MLRDRNAIGCTLSFVLAAMLAGCSAASFDSPFDSAQGDTGAAKGGDLLYVSDGTFGNVYAFSFPGAKLVGELTHLETPEGVCHDATGNVYIVMAGSATIAEYAHGGSQPITILSDPSGTPLGCSIDPRNGDLAVVNETGPSGGSGSPPNVVIYKNARGKPATISDKDASALYFCAYDGSGNLFVDGANTAGRKGLLVELPKGRTKFLSIALDKSVNPTGGVQWDGKYLDVGDRNGSSGHADVYRLSISSGKSKKVYSTPLDGDNDIVSFWIAGRTIVGGDIIAGSVMYWPYPRGGNATKNLMGFSDPVAMTVSI